VHAIGNGKDTGPLKGTGSVPCVWIADELAAGSVGLVADLFGAGAFQIVESGLGGAAENIVGAVVVDNSQGKEEIPAGITGAVNVAAGFDGGRVGIVTGRVFAVGRRTVGGALDEISLDVTSGARRIKVVESVFDNLGNVGFWTVIVVGLNNVVVVDASFGGTVGGARVGVQVGHGLQHGVGIGTVDGEAFFFGNAGARFARGLAEKSQEEEQGSNFHHGGN